MVDLLASPLLGIALCIFAYALGEFIRAKTGLSFLHPLILATIFIIIIIGLTPLTLENFQEGGSFITLFILPCTTVLALNIFKQWETLKKNVLPILIGCAVGSVVSMVSVVLLCKAFKVSDEILYSFLPKSVTTSIAIELSAKNSGIPAITVSAVIFTGIGIAIFSPFFLKILKDKDSIATGAAMGTAGHAVGTSKAVEFGETQGAISGIALAVTGVIVSIIYMFI